MCCVVYCLFFFFFFFFSSRRRHTRFDCDWSSDVCSSDLTVAVLLPGAFYFLKEKQLPPIEALRRHGVPIALATDHNPGSSPLSSPLLVLNMACTLFRLTLHEALAGMTRHAGRALGIEGTHGTLEVGKRADAALWEVASPAELAYAIGANPCVGLMRNGAFPRAAT